MEQSELNHSLKCLSILSGVPCHIVEEKDDTPINISSDSRFCEMMRKEHCSSECKNTYHCASLFSELYGGRYISFCYGKLVFCITPPLLNYSRASLTAGPFLIVDRNDFLDSDLPDSIEQAKAKRFLDDVPCLSLKKATALSEVLYELFLSYGGYKNSGLGSKNPGAIFNQLSALKPISPLDDKGVILDRERELTRCIANGNLRESGAVLNDLLGNIYLKTEGDIKGFKGEILELMVLITRAAIAGGAGSEQLIGLKRLAMERILSSENNEEITFILNDTLRRFTTQVFYPPGIIHSGAIKRSLAYIHTVKYCKATLGGAAAAAGISPAYFSRIFRSEMGVRFIDYVNNLRVEKVKDILNCGGTIADAAAEVGFFDQSHLTRTFKKITGISPGEYRKKGYFSF